MNGSCLGPHTCQRQGETLQTEGDVFPTNLLSLRLVRYKEVLVISLIKYTVCVLLWATAMHQMATVSRHDDHRFSLPPWGVRRRKIIKWAGFPLDLLGWHGGLSAAMLGAAAGPWHRGVPESAWHFARSLRPRGGGKEGREGDNERLEEGAVIYQNQVYHQVGEDFDLMSWCIYKIKTQIEDSFMLS